MTLSAFTQIIWAVFFSEILDTPCTNTIIYGDFGNDVVQILRGFKDQHFTTLSEAAKHRYSFLKNIEVIPYGIKCEDFPFNEKPGDYLLFLARVDLDKGTHLAIQAAIELNQKIIVAGPYGDSNYFREEIEPLVKNYSNARYVGNADYKTKINFAEKC